jgi:hypothetical protein
MKFLGIASTTAVIGLAAVVVDRPAAERVGGTSSHPPGCLVAVAGAPGYLPRAGLTIHNRRSRPVHAWLEPRNGLARRELGTIGIGESLTFAHALPAGRNLLHARPEAGAGIATVLYVANRGAGTCSRRYLWRIE